MNQDTDKIFTENLALIAEKAAIKSGKFALKNLDSKFEVFSKGGQKNNLVTEIDRKNQESIISIIKTHFPNHSIIGEEDKKSAKPMLSDIVWVIDPIDGTTNFVNGIPLFSVSIGVLLKGTPIAGAIWCPWLNGEHLSLKASLGNGATINNQKNKIENVDTSKLSEGGIATLPSNIESYFEIKKKKKKYIGEKRVLGSVAFEMMLIAQGISTYGILGPASSWDFAAGIIIIKESGGKILTPGNKKKWVKFNSFADDYKINRTTIEKIRNWKGIFIAGSENIVNYVTKNFIPKEN